jgi:porin
MTSAIGYATAQEAPESIAVEEPVSIQTRIYGFADDPQDPANQLEIIRQRNMHREGLIPFSLLQPFRDGFTEFKDTIYDATNLRLGMSFHHVSQTASKSMPGTAHHAETTDFDFVGTWELFNQGTPYQGDVVFGVEGRWDYHTIGPQNIGFASLGTAGGTANSFSAYNPTFLLRNLYYRQGSPEAGWVFRFGKITPDSMLATNRHITPNTTFLPNAGTGLFVNSYADSGLGAAGALYFGDSANAYVAGLISDANGNRYDWGDLGESDFYKAVEFGLKIAPLTEKASYSKFTLWHTDGTSDGKAINANTGKQGWGYSAILTQELSEDGNLVAVGRYGQSFGGAAIYDQQAGIHLLQYQPFGKFDNDVVGLAFNWINSTFAGTRDEYNVETFYRFPLFPDVDATLSYQGVINPAFNTTFDYASVFSLRLTSSF